MPSGPTYSGYWFRVPVELEPLRGLSGAEYAVYLAVLSAIQRDRAAGRISLRQIVERAGLSNAGNAQRAVAELCRRGVLVRVNPITGEPIAQADSKGRSVAYVAPVQWRQRDTENCCRDGNSLRMKPQKIGEVLLTRNKIVAGGATEPLPPRQQHSEYSESPESRCAASAVSRTPLYHAAIRLKFPRTDDAFCERLAQECRRRHPSATDEEIALAVARSNDSHPDQRGAGLYLRTAPEELDIVIVRNRPQAERFAR